MHSSPPKEPFLAAQIRISKREALQEVKDLLRETAEAEADDARFSALRDFAALLEDR